MHRESLQPAYLATTYFIELPAGRIGVRIGSMSSEWEQFLESQQLREWAIITAHNPSSIPQTASVNNSRHKKLVRAAGTWKLFPGVNVSDGNDWPVEPTIVILGISENDAQAIAHRFGQAAFLAGRTGEPARLVWCES